MHPLFKETRAYEQIVHSTNNDPEKTETVANRAFEEFIRQSDAYGRGDSEEDVINWLICEAINNDKHLLLDIDKLFIWDRTEEGQNYWQGIYYGRLLP